MLDTPSRSEMALIWVALVATSASAWLFVMSFR